MALPKSVTPESVFVKLSGGEVEIRPLSFAQVETASKAGGQFSNELAIGFATGTDPIQDVRPWLETALAGDVEKLLATITEISQIGEKAQFRSGT